jgi:predicted RNA-binding Zn-ribbon protein involved in translation (DUF1610 family)
MKTKKWKKKNEQAEQQRCIICGSDLPKDEKRTVNLCPNCEARIALERDGVA